MTDRSPFIVVGIPYSPNRIGALEDWLEKLSLQLREKEREVRGVGLWPSAVAAVAAAILRLCFADSCCRPCHATPAARGTLRHPSHRACSQSTVRLWDYTVSVREQWHYTPTVTVACAQAEELRAQVEVRCAAACRAAVQTQNCGRSDCSLSRSIHCYHY